MNKNLLNSVGVVLTAIVIGVTAGCATVQTAFAPGMVAEAKSAGGAGPSSSALVPGRVDLGVPNANPQASYDEELVPGSVDLTAPESAGPSGQEGALIPGSIDLQGFQDSPRPSFSGQLTPGGIDLRWTSQPSSTFRESPSAPWFRRLAVPR